MEINDHTRMRSSVRLMGFEMKSSAPHAIARCTLARSVRAVTMTTGVVAPPGSARSRPSVSKPSMPGMRTSRRTRDGGPASKAASAARPLSASSTV